ncbi:MAG: rsr [Verrucomicrobiaceae bacterium]|nr:rsr [Verrucomicrobiaceae bacterium]
MWLNSQRNPTTETISFAGGEALAKTLRLDFVGMPLIRRLTVRAEFEDCQARDWEQLIKTGRLGYFALLRDLRTVLTSVPHLINEVVDMLTDERLIRRSRVRPSCFLPAVQALEKDPPYGALRVLAALSDAVDLSQAHEPRVSGSRPLLRMDSGKQVLVGSIALV